jgi:hypothetical protein
LESFSYELQFDMHFYMHSYLHKKFILVKSGCYSCPDRPFSVELGDTEINTRILLSLLMGPI